MSQTKNDKFLTIAIVVLSVAGLLYFGISAIQSDRRKNQENPFEYNFDNFKQSGQELVTYTEINTIDLSLENPHAIAVNAKGIYVTSGNNVVILDSVGQRLAGATVSRDITALTIDVNHDVYVTALNHVEVLDSTLTRKALWPIPGSGTVLTSIAVSEHDVFLADAGQRVVWRFDKSGQFLNKIGKKDESKDVPGFIIPSPYFDVLVDSDGYLWAVNTGRHQFENYLFDGTLRSSWAQSSMSVDGFSGCCNPVHVALLQDGSFVTSEKGILRVKIHNQIGELVTVVAMPDQFDKETSVLDVAVNAKQEIFVLDPKRKQVRVFQKRKDGA